MRSLSPALLLLIGACSLTDAPTAPGRDSERTFLPSGELVRGLVAPPAPTDTGRTVLTVRPEGDTLMFGSHMLVFEANAVCDPATSSYGVSEWLMPCRMAATPISFEVKWWTDSRGFPRVEFLRDLRFSPSSKVWLFLHDPKGAPLPSATVLYCPRGSAFCYNESTTDPELKTQRAPDVSCTYRRLRHFSGYNVWA